MKPSDQMTPTQRSVDPGVNRVLWVADNLTTGGIGTVCRDAAQGLARLAGWRATVASLRPPPSDRIDSLTGVRFVALGLRENEAQSFLRWLARNPQQFIVTNDVPQIESAFSHFPLETLHIIGLHDSAWRQLDVAVRNSRAADGVLTVARHIQDRLEPALKRVNFRGLLETVHNGAVFPAAPTRTVCPGPMRLLYMGSMDPFKGIFDLVPILRGLVRLNVPARLTIAGGTHDLLQRQFKRYQLDSLVTWVGWVPHEQCYRLAAEGDVLLMPSRKEAFGMATLEAMSMGCVPLAYDINSGSREIVEDGKSGLLLPLGHFAAWSRALKSLYDNRDEWLRLSRGATERARVHFSAEIMALNLATFLRKVQAHAQACPSERRPGLPPEVATTPKAPRSRYQRLSPGLREWIRNRIGASPRLCHWLLSRW